MYAVVSYLGNNAGAYLHGMYERRDEALIAAAEMGNKCVVIEADDICSPQTRINAASYPPLPRLTTRPPTR